MSEQKAFTGGPSAAGTPPVGQRPGPAVSRWLSRDRLAVLAGVAAPLALAAILVPFRASFPNTDAALALLLVVVAVAADGYRLAGLLAAVSAMVWFDFFLTRPYERFAIAHRSDIETAVLLLAIGIAVTELAVWGRRQQAVASRRAGYLDGINTAAGCCRCARAGSSTGRPGSAGRPGSGATAGW
jgi:K+-sensing histidine kinase KdpD